MTGKRRVPAAFLLAAAGAGAPALAGDNGMTLNSASFASTSTALLFQDAGPAATAPAPTSSAIESPTGYRGLSDFFNVREANSNVEEGEWELEFTYEYFTRSGEDDEHEIEQSIKYGFSDSCHIELEVEEPLGDGGDGAGELYLTFFGRWWAEEEALPAFATAFTMRIPSGVDSSGVDGTANFILTKSLSEAWRVHLAGYIPPAHGAQGGEEEEDRRHFQWAVGPGVDFKIDEGGLMTLNYLHRVNDQEGERNQNLLEWGYIRKLGELWGGETELKLALDLTLDGNESTPNFGTKLQWGIEW
jgi:hypothetical protein